MNERGSEILEQSADAREKDRIAEMRTQSHLHFFDFPREGVQFPPAASCPCMFGLLAAACVEVGRSHDIISAVGCCAVVDTQSRCVAVLFPHTKSRCVAVLS